ncbi:protein translocase SEC61 complex subunit gamma [Candidatus Micrarchaeota archaeon]|nr:protein translocase SEC61 complex subunit gamma [Candidatus Micrarchaeota archaeon]
MIDILGFIRQSRKVFYAFYKPTWSEFKQTAYVTGLGMILIGVIGAVIYLIFKTII